MYACSGYCEDEDDELEVVQKQCDNCNAAKLNAKSVSERSDELFFSIFLKVNFFICLSESCLSACLGQ